MNPTHTSPEDVFLTSHEVFARYRWGRTKGYQEVRAPGFPNPIKGSYRLDTLQAWEATQLNGPHWDNAVTQTNILTATAQDSPPERRSIIGSGSMRGSLDQVHGHCAVVPLSITDPEPAVEPASLPGRRRSRGRSRTEVA